MTRFHKLFYLPLLALILTSCNTSSNSNGSDDSNNHGHEHTFSLSWTYDDTYHWHESTCGHDVTSGKQSHSFSEWSYLNPPTYSTGGTEHRYCYVCNYEQTRNVDKLKYSVNFDLNGGTSAQVLNQSVSSFDEIQFSFDCHKDNYNFRGWSYNGNIVFDEDGNSIYIPNLVNNMTFVACFSQTAKMTIISNIENAGYITGEGEYPYNTNVDVSAYAKQGYSFVGWYYQNTLLSNTNEYRYMMWNYDVTLEARFELNSYTLNIHTYNSTYGLVKFTDIGDVAYTEYCNNSVKYTKERTISAYSKTSIRFLGWYDDNNELVATNAVYTFSMPNHDYSLEAKWNYFTISYNLNGGTNNSSNPSYYFNNSGDITLYSPTKTGCVFVGWKYNGNYITKIQSSWLCDINLEAEWSIDTSWDGSPIYDASSRTITYGLYPQTRVNSPSLIESLNSLAEPTTNGWYLLNNMYYARTNANPYKTSYEFNDGQTILLGTTYWFKCEPIVWNIINQNNGEYFLVSKVLLDSQIYCNTAAARTIDGKTVYANNYEFSDIRRWLITDFYNSAFFLENTHIQTVNVNNNSSTTYDGSSSYICATTQDKVFLLSYQDYVNNNYGFGSKDSRCCLTTDWARAKHAIYSEDANSYKYCGRYWTRSPRVTGNTCMSVIIPDGSFYQYYNSACESGHGVRPAIKITL